MVLHITFKSEFHQSMGKNHSEKWYVHYTCIYVQKDSILFHESRSFFWNFPQQNLEKYFLSNTLCWSVLWGTVQRT